MTGGPELVVLGDINLDWVARGTLPFPFANLTENGVIAWVPIDQLPGGSGLNFAETARKRGLRPLLLGKVGDDPAGRYVQEWLQARDLASGVAVDGATATGIALIARDARDIRLLMNNVTNANAQVTTADMERHREAIRSCSVLYVSGYCVKDPTVPRHAATIGAMELAATAPSRAPVVVFDVVPHRIYEVFDFDQFRALTRHVGVLISEVSTMRRFLGLGDKSEQLDERISVETATHLKPYYERFLLRYGPSGCDVELLWDGVANHMRVEATNHATAAEKRGFGDVLALRALCEEFRLL